MSSKQLTSGQTVAFFVHQPSRLDMDRTMRNTVALTMIKQAARGLHKLVVELVALLACHRRRHHHRQSDVTLFIRRSPTSIRSPLTL